MLTDEYERVKEALREGEEAMLKSKDEMTMKNDTKLVEYEGDLLKRSLEVERLTADLAAQCTSAMEAQEKLTLEEIKSSDLDEKLIFITDEFNFYKVQHAQLLSEEKSKLNASRISEGENTASFEREILRLNTVLSGKNEEYLILEGMMNSVQSEVDVLKEEKRAQIEKDKSNEDNLLLTITSSANDMESLNMTIQDLDLAVSSANKSITELQEEISSANKSNTELQEEISSANKSNTELREELSSANKSNTELQE